MDLLTAVLLLPLDIEIDPNSNGLPRTGQLKKIVGASMTVGLVLAVLALIPCCCEVPRQWSPPCAGGRRDRRTGQMLQFQVDP